MLLKYHSIISMVTIIIYMFKDFVIFIERIVKLKYGSSLPLKMSCE